MWCVSADSHGILLFLALLVMPNPGLSLAKSRSASGGNGTPGFTKTASKQWGNVYNRFYSVPANEKIETLLLEVKKQLINMQKDINILKGKKSCTKG